jgi:hypothetical protein
MPKPRCEICKWYGFKVLGCYWGGYPNRSDPCLHPDKFVEKIMPPHRIGGTPEVWHFTGYKILETEKSTPTKKTSKKATPQRDGKGRFVRRKK